MVHEESEDDEEAFVNVAVCAVHDGWKTQNASWLEMEAVEEGVVYFVNMVRGGQMQTRVRAEGRLCLPKQEGTLGTEGEAGMGNEEEN